MTDNTHGFLTHLWRGGEWVYFWTPDGKNYTDKQTGEIKQGKLSQWFPAGAVAPLPKAWAAKNVYFGVHPAHTQRQQWERARLVDVAAINCLFAEFDGKDQVTPGEYSPHLPPDFDQLPAIAQRAAIVDAQQAIFLADRETHKARIMAQLDALWNGGDGLPYPSVVIDSQGGYHCYWLLEQTVTIDDGNREHIKALQAAWVDLVGADSASKDLARVLRLPGTQNRKTHYAPDFPTVTFVECNLSRLYSLDIFEQFANVDAAGHAAHQAMAATTAKQTDGVIASFNQSHSLVDLLTAAGYTLGWQRGNVARLSRPGKPKNETSVIVFTDINRSYHHSGNDPLHTTGHTRDAFDVWTQITHNGDTKAAWAAAKQEQGKWEAAPVLVFDHKPQSTAARQDRSKWSAADLLTAQFPEPRWAVPALIPAGLSVLAGRPKMGKSFLGLQVAVAVGSGGMVLDRRVEAGRVLYYALEDSARRVQSRLLKQQATATTNVDFQFILDAPLSTAVGVGRLIEEITTNQYRLVVIDTISRALGKADQTNQAEMNVGFGLLQQAAIKTDTALLLIDHHRKSAGGLDGGDVIDDVMAATSKTAVADAVLGLYRKRGERTATLKLAGRDVMELELAVTFDKDLCCWQFVGQADEVRADEVQGQILEAIRNAGGQATASQLMRLLNKQLPNILRELAELENKNLVLRGAKQGREVPWMLTK